MPEDVQHIPLEGPGSQTPGQLPSLHTPVGEGAKSTGVNNVGKAKGLPGAPALGGDAPAGGVGGAPIEEIKTPDDLLIDRSNIRLEKDLKDVYLRYISDNEESKEKEHGKQASIKNAKSNTKYDFNNVDFEYVIDRLINQKGWHVDRLKELIPSRDEKVIIEFFNKLTNSQDQEEVDVDQQKNNSIDLFKNNQGSSNLMSKESDLIVDNGAIKTASANSSLLLDEISYSIGQVRTARKNLKKAFLTKVGFEAMQDMASAGSGMDIEMGGDMDAGMGGSFGPDIDPIDVSSFDEGLSGGKDLKSLVDAVKSALDNLTEKVEEFGLTSDTLSSDDMLKGDALIDKASDEIKKTDSDLDTIESFEEKDDKKDDKKDSKPFDKKDDKKEEKKEEKKEDKFASAEGSYKPEERGKKIDPSIPEGAGWEQKGEKSTRPAEDAMAVTTGTKSAYLQEIKEKLAKLKQVRETSVNKSAAYPFNDLNKQEVTDQFGADASAQASEINKDMTGGFQVPDESLGIKGEGNPKDPGMTISEPADIKQASVSDFNKVATAANSLARKAVSQAVAKTRVAMEVSSIQQLKGLLSNPLRDELVNKFAEYGIDKNDAKAIVHNAFLSSYEDSQKIVIAEAFDTLSNKDDNEFVKVASFTKEFNGSDSDTDDSSATDDASNDIINKEASAEAKTVKTAALRGAQVNNDNSQVYTNFWRGAYEESKGL